MPEKYESIFLNEAEKSGVVKKIDMHLPELYNSSEIEEAEQNYRSYLSERVDDIQNIFRIALLFDEIILANAPMDYDYKTLQGTGQFKIIPFDDFYYDNPISHDGHKEYAIHLKPAIIPLAEEELKSYYRHLPTGYNFTALVSDIYDTVLFGKKLDKKYDWIIEQNHSAFNERNQHNFVLSRQMGMPDILLEDRRFFTDTALCIQTLYESLCWQLKISSENESAIMNCQFQLADIGCGSYLGNAEDSMEAYKILRIECGKMMGTLPEVKNLQDVFRLKTKRRHDLHNLKQELSRLEYEIRNNGTESAVNKAALDISKASKALSTGSTVSKVNRWTNIFMIPLGIASLYLQYPQIAIGAGIITTAGRVTTEIGTIISNNNKWFEILL